MTDPEGERRPLPAPSRRLTPAEVDEILRRASVAETPLAGTDLGSVSLDDLAAAAAEAGLDPATVRRAAAVVPPRTGGVLERVVGGADRREASAFLPGAQIPDERRGLVATAETGLGLSGEVRESAPGIFDWRARSAGGEASVTLRADDAGTEIRVSSRRGAHYLGLWLLGLGGWAGLSALTPLGALGPLGFAASFVLVPVLLARPFWVRADRRMRGRLERTALELARVVEEGSGAPGAADGSG